jgi:hypothetical protein
VGGGVDEGAGEGSGEEVAKRVLSVLAERDLHTADECRLRDPTTYALLQDTTHESTGFLGTILEGCGRRIAIEAAHCHAEERATG